jgi:hypothetical protein
MSWFYPIKVNTALAAMAVPPNQFNGEWRSGMQHIGKTSGLTPQETALVIVAHGLGINFPMDVETAIGVWRHEGNVNIEKPEIVDALHRMGFRM